MVSPKKESLFYEFGPFRVEAKERLLLRDGKPVALTSKSFEILLLLVENSGHIVEKDELMKRVWPETFVEEANLANNISLLRKVLGPDFDGNQYIQTVPRRGYRFIADVSITQEAVAPAIANGRPPFINEETVRRPEMSDRSKAAASTQANRPATKKVILAGVLIGAILLGFWAAALHFRGAGARAPSSGTGPIRSLAVLPFKPIVADSRDESLEIGMADTLITKLGGISEIIIRPESSVRKYSALEQDPVAAGRELKVDAVLDGSLQAVDERIRVTVRLTRVADRRPLWLDQFDEKMADILALQDSISAKVTSALSLKLSSEDQRLLAKRYTTSTESYNLYLKGRLFWNKRTEEGMRKAIEYFRQAIDKDPNYALAYSGLADSYAILGNYLNRPDELHPEALEVAEKAVEKDDSLAEAHTSLAYVLAHRHNWLRAEAEFKRAIELNPNYATTHHWYAKWLQAYGRLDEGLAEMKRAQELDPTSLIINTALGGHYYSNRMYDEAIGQLHETLEMDPNFIHAHASLAYPYIKKGMIEDARTEVQKAVELSGGSLTSYRALLAYVYAVAGRRREAQKISDELVKRSKSNQIWPGDIAFIYLGLGDKEQLFRWLEKAYEKHDLTIDVLIAEPLWDPVRSDSRFEDLLRRVRLRQSQ